MLNAVTDPLHRFPVFRTSDPEELAGAEHDLVQAPTGVDLKHTEQTQTCASISLKLQEIGLSLRRDQS